MEINTNIIIGLLFIVILVLLFSNISVSLESDQINNTSEYERPVINNNYNHPVNNPSSGRSVTFNETRGLPKKDNYMSNNLRKQLNSMENKFYYNNCRWEPNF